MRLHSLRPPNPLWLMAPLGIAFAAFAFWVPGHRETRERHRCERLGQALSVETRYVQGVCWIRRPSGWAKT